MLNGGTVSPYLLIPRITCTYTKQFLFSLMALTSRSHLHQTSRRLHPSFPLLLLVQHLSGRLRESSPRRTSPRRPSLLSTSLTATFWAIILSRRLSTSTVCDLLCSRHYISDLRLILVDKQGISSRFLSFFNNLDSTIGNKVVGENKTVSGKIQEHAAAAVAKTREVDQSRGISSRFHEYYSKVIGTPVGQK